MTKQLRHMLKYISLACVLYARDLIVEYTFLGFLYNNAQVEFASFRY